MFSTFGEWNSEYACHYVLGICCSSFYGLVRVHLLLVDLEVEWLMFYWLIFRGTMGAHRMAGDTGRQRWNCGCSRWTKKVGGESLLFALVLLVCWSAISADSLGRDWPLYIFAC